MENLIKSVEEFKKLIIEEIHEIKNIMLKIEYDVNNIKNDIYIEEEIIEVNDAPNIEDWAKNASQEQLIQAMNEFMKHELYEYCAEIQKYIKKK